jgi:glycyl-tRNA synthetase beta chain
MPELLLELFSEEIPARMQAKAARDLERLVHERLLAAGFRPDGVKAFAGPRRLAFVAGGLPLRQSDREEEKKGPRVGAPPAAIDGFLKAAGLSSLAECDIVEDKKGSFYVARLKKKGRETRAVLAEEIPSIIQDFPWPKSMRWDSVETRWVRPLRSVLCCFDNEVVPFAVDGVASGDETFGHRSVSGTVRARNFDSYVAALTGAKVMLDGAARLEMIDADARTLCAAQGLELVEDKGLLAEVAGLAEWPVVRIGAFDRKFLALPDEVLVSVMRKHQKYFAVRDPNTGRLAPRFVFVANLDAADGGAAMRAGYERVLAARLADAWYLYHQDLKIPLEERLGALDRVTFFEGLGTMGDKARRIAALAREIAPAVGADRQLAEDAARLAKADLVTGMVGEFPDLQGVMGRYYYLAQHGTGAAPIAAAIRDHYKPAGAEDEAPTAPVSIAVALADRLDTLAAFWAIDKKPTGSSDPFALRRAALGVIAILLESNSAHPGEIRDRETAPRCARLSLTGVVDSHRRRLADFAAGSQSLTQQLLAFFHDRLKVYLREKGHRHDQIDAVLMKADGAAEDDLALIVMKLEALEAFLKSDDGANLAAGYKRAGNILKAEEKKGALPKLGAVDEKRLKQAEEKALFHALKRAEEKAEKAVAAERFADAMAALASLRPAVDAFFDKVTVNAEDKDLRANRLALLQRFIDAAARVADLSKLEG